MKETEGLKNKVKISPNLHGMQHLVLKSGDTNLAKPLEANLETFGC